MRNVAIVSFSQAPNVRSQTELNEVEMLMPVVHEAIEQSGIPKDEIGFYCSGSSDFISGQAFAFVGAVDALGAWPPIRESHVEMDGAWALYEAWVKIQCGDIDSAVAFGFGRASLGNISQTLNLQLDPYTLGPLGIDTISMAALQARALLDTGKYTVEDLAQVAARNRAAGKSNPYAQVSGDYTVEQILAEPCIASPLNKHLCPPVTDGASAVVIAAEGSAAEKASQRAWIKGYSHYLDTHQPGGRDLTVSESARLAGDKAGLKDGDVEVAELHAPFAHEELILREALGLGDSVRINPSGGALCANPMMTAGLTRLGEAAREIWEGRAQRTLGHATSGPCLQQNLVCILEGE